MVSARMSHSVYLAVYARLACAWGGAPSDVKRNGLNLLSREFDDTSEAQFESRMTGALNLVHWARDNPHGR